MIGLYIFVDPLDGNLSLNLVMQFQRMRNLAVLPGAVYRRGEPLKKNIRRLAIFGKKYHTFSGLLLYDKDIKSFMQVIA